MTNNTINNVPRELLERAWRASANSATGREIGAYLDADPCAPECAETCVRASMCAACSADLSAPSPAGVDVCKGKSCGATDGVSHSAECFAEHERVYSCAGVDGLEVVAYRIGGEPSLTPCRVRGVVNEPLCRLSDAQAIIDGLRAEVGAQRAKTCAALKARNDAREERDSFQRIGIRQIEHRYQLAALLLEKFPRIDPHHPITLSEVDHCCEYVLHKDRERLHCAIDAALSAGKEGE